MFIMKASTYFFILVSDNRVEYRFIRYLSTIASLFGFEFVVQPNKKRVKDMNS